MPLQKLQKELQQMAEAIMSVTGLDVTIMDKNLKRIAGTGRHRLTVGKFAPKDSVFEKSIKTNKEYIIRQPRTCPECSQCKGKTDCTEKAEVCYPIKNEDSVVGVIGMIAFNEEQRKAFLQNEDNFMNFVGRMSRLISSRIREQALNKQLLYKSMELATIIDAVDEGILAIDEEGKILHVNHWVMNLLQIQEDITGEHIDTILPQNRVTKALKTCSKINDQEEILKIKNGFYRFLISVKPIMINSVNVGAVATFKDFNKLHRSIVKIRENPGELTFKKILGKSPNFIRVKKQAKEVAAQNATVLLLGESGTGKELFARAIHNESPRRDEVFMAINCGAIPDSLIESELFGYEKGSFTGANPGGKIGKFEMANKGTVFLDEIGDMPLHMQVKLLRVLQEQEIIRVGGLVPIKIDVRIIAATNQDLWEMVKKGEFREDLYYRLNVVPINIPPLRERPDDILELASKLLERYSKIYEKNIKDISLEAEKLLLQHSWPGNVRELENLIEYGVIFEKGRKLTAKTLSKKITSEVKGKITPKGTLKEIVAEYEKKIITNSLKQYGDDLMAKEKVAKDLGISIPTLYRKIRE